MTTQIRLHSHLNRTDYYLFTLYTFRQEQQILHDAIRGTKIDTNTKTQNHPPQRVYYMLGGVCAMCETNIRCDTPWRIVYGARLRLVQWKRFYRELTDDDSTELRGSERRLWVFSLRDEHLWSFFRFRPKLSVVNLNASACATAAEWRPWPAAG